MSESRAADLAMDGDLEVGVDVDIVVPVHNEAAGLEQSIRTLHSYLRTDFPLSYRITIADNASTDGTLGIARRIAAELPGVRVIHLEQKGRGRALRQAWLSSGAIVVAYMDVDLSTDLTALLPLIAPLLSGHSHLGIGTRLARSASVIRGPKREGISRCYNHLLRATLRVGFSDAQCGFKAIRADVARELVPLVEDQAWFFDTELLVIAERSGLRIHEVPVDWVDDPDSRVAIVDTAVKDLQGLWRLVGELHAGRLPLDRLRTQFAGRPTRPGRPGRPGRPPAGRGTIGSTGLNRHPTAPRLDQQSACSRTRPAKVCRRSIDEYADRGQPVQCGRRFREIGSFAAIGAVSTLAYVGLYAALRPTLPKLAANLLALLLTAIGNTEANRRWTFGVRGPGGGLRHQLQGLGAFVVALLVSTGALLAFSAVDPAPGAAAEVTVLVTANLISTALRFVLLRRGITGNRQGRAAREDLQPAAALSPAKAASSTTMGESQHAVADLRPAS